MSASACNELVTPLVDFNEAIEPFGDLFENSPAKVLVAFDGERLHIDAPGFSTAMPAQGQWQGQVRVPAQFFFVLARIPPKVDPVAIRTTSTHLCVHRSRVVCQWTETLQQPLDVPLFMPLRKALHLAATASPQELLDNGLSSLVYEAVARRDFIIAGAANSLEELGITEEELHRLVAVKIHEEYSS